MTTMSGMVGDAFVSSAHPTASERDVVSIAATATHFSENPPTAGERDRDGAEMGCMGATVADEVATGD
jgi:hypothetical protein